MRRTTICLLATATLSLAACGSTSQRAENEANCKSVKPGVVSSVNHYCVIVPEDPVDPAITREWRGQMVGFCCQHCVGEWAEMSDARKDTALAAAVKKGVPSNQ